MGPLSKDNTIENQDAAWAQAHRMRHAALFDGCESLSRDVLSFILELHVRNRDGRQLLTSTLLARAFQLHLSCLQAVERGIEGPADVLLRALLEVVFTICAIARQAGTLERYISDDYVTRLKLLNAARASKSAELTLAKGGATDE